MKRVPSVYFYVLCKDLQLVSEHVLLHSTVQQTHVCVNLEIEHNLLMEWPNSASAASWTRLHHGRQQDIMDIKNH